MRDRAIIQSIIRQEAGVMNLLMDKYSRLLWSIVSAVLQNIGSEQDVEEVVADAFIYLWEHPQKFDSHRGTLKQFLCIVARSRALDRYRELSRKSTLPLEEALQACGLDLQEQYITAETHRELLDALKHLQEPGREILFRRYYYGQKPREIALALNLSVKQVDNALYRSKRILRDVLTTTGGKA